MSTVLKHALSLSVDIRGMRVTVGTILGLLAAGRTHEEVLQAYPYLEPDDIRAALSYAA